MKFFSASRFLKKPIHLVLGDAMTKSGYSEKKRRIRKKTEQVHKCQANVQCVPTFRFHKEHWLFVFFR